MFRFEWRSLTFNICTHLKLHFASTGPAWGPHIFRFPTWESGTRRNSLHTTSPACHCQGSAEKVNTLHLDMKLMTHTKLKNDNLMRKQNNQEASCWSISAQYGDQHNRSVNCDFCLVGHKLNVVPIPWVVAILAGIVRVCQRSHNQLDEGLDNAPPL